MKKELNIKKTSLTVIILNLLQIGILVGLMFDQALLGRIFHLKSPAQNLAVLFWVAVGVVFINSILGLRDAYVLFKAHSQSEMLKDSLEQLEELNYTLRGQRHDFLNHLQVVYGLMEMDEYQEAKEYIEKVYDDIQKVSRVLKTANPAVNALLQAKALDCEKRGIKVEMRITSSLKHLSMPGWEFCRVLSNIIDNAIDALTETTIVYPAGAVSEELEAQTIGSAAPREPEEKRIEIELYEDLKSFGFRISNNGPPIPAAHLEKIFEPEFTTKGAEGEGMGLAISQQIMEERGGRIYVTTRIGKTVFEGQFPK
jgi:two-component system sensor histidine kinase AgrC